MASRPKPPVQVRRAAHADLPRLLQIERSALTSAHWPEADYEAALTTAQPLRWLLLAEIDRQVEGFLVARSAHASEWELENIVVAEPSRRVGFATLLLKTFLEQANTKTPSGDPLTIHLEVRESNLPARRLYEKFGFRLDNRRTAYYSHPTEDALLYSLSLQ
jgi:ribosomal-protein-alanine N-acetyltransferase